MAVEKFNHKPWHDNHNHAGRHSHEMRSQAAEYELQEFLNGELPVDMPSEAPESPQSIVNGSETVLFNRRRHQDNLGRLHGYYYKGTYYHQGVGQPNKSERKK